MVDRRRRASFGLTLLGMAIIGTFPSARPQVRPDTPELGIADRDDAEKALDEGRGSEVEAWARRVLVETEQAHGPDSLETARVIDALLRSRRVQRLRSTAEDRDLAERALAIRERLLGEQDIELVPALRSLVGALRVTQCHPEERPLLERSISIVERYGERGELLLAEVLLDLVTYFWNCDSFEEGATLAQRALLLYEKNLGPDALEVADVTFQLARLAYFDGQLRTAGPLLDRAIAICEAGGHTDHPLYPFCLNLRGKLRKNEGDFVGARHDFEEAMRIRQRVRGPGHAEVGQSILNLGDLMQTFGDLEAARSQYQRAFGIWEALGDARADTALAHTCLGAVALETGDTGVAGQHYRQALALLELSGGPDHIYYPIALVGLGKLFIETGDADQARRALEQALPLFERHYQKTHPQIAEIQALLSRADEMEGKLPSAIDRAGIALEMREEIFGPEHPLVAESRVQYARLLRAAGDYSVALQQALRAAEINREHLRLAAESLPERQALKYGVLLRSGLDALLELAAEAPGIVPPSEVWDAVIQSRALVLDEMASRHHAVVVSTDPEIVHRRETFEHARARAAFLALVQPDAAALSHADRIAAALRAKEEAERALAEKSLAFREHERRAAVGIEDIRAALPPASALVAYVRFGKHRPAYGVFVMTSRQKGPPRFIDLGSAKPIEDAVAGWRGALRDEPPLLASQAAEAEVAYRHAAVALRRAVWDRIAKEVAGAVDVFVVPDGVLHLVNFDTLPVGVGDYLVDGDFVLRYLSTERDLVKPRLEERALGGLLALGGPDYDGAPSRRGQGDAAASYRGPLSSCMAGGAVRFPPLPMAEIEVREIGELWSRAATGQRPPPAVRVLHGAEAAEAAFKEQAPAYGVLHVATHGFFLRPCHEVDGRPQLLLSENPLLRSGLAWAGANRRTATMSEQTEDGILTAEEIASLDLSGVELAVLSACETGIGDLVEGEGVLGLRRAFAIAGAQALVMSLWDISDEAALQWMRAFYTSRLEGGSVSWSVREASRQSVASRRAAGKSTHPFYWGAFVGAESTGNP